MEKIPCEPSVGTDLEMFLYDNEAKKIAPCVGVLEGTKDKPYKPVGATEGFAIQEDNVMVEFNIPPAQTQAEFRNYVNTAKNMVLRELKLRHGDRYSLYTKDHTHVFEAQDLASKQAQLIGCDPDMSAYDGGSVRTNPPAPGLRRSCGGHIHLGGNFNCPDFVAALFAELYLGPITHYSEDDDPRREWYGKAGIYRPKPYGIEYRTPNNKWGTDAGRTEVVGSYAITCAKYLTETDALGLQAAFRAIPWLLLRQYIDGTTKTPQDNLNAVMRAARKAGVPV